jgi:hypothetical protein
MKRHLLFFAATLGAAGCLSRTDTDCTDNLSCGTDSPSEGGAEASTDAPAAPSDGGADQGVDRDVDASSVSVDAGTDSSPSDGGSDGDAKIDVFVCDDSATPAQASCVIRSERGIFVSPNGDDSGSGASDAPMKTIQAALTKAKSSAKRVYACEGTYDEHVTSGAAVDGVFVYGGIDCALGTYDATKRPIVARGWQAENLVTGVTIEDFEIRSPDATAAGTSSIAVIANAAQVTLRRVKVSAGKGAKGQPGVNGAVGTDGDDPTDQQHGISERAPLHQCFAQAEPGVSPATVARSAERGELRFVTAMVLPALQETLVLTLPLRIATTAEATARQEAMDWSAHPVTLGHRAR